MSKSTADLEQLRLEMMERKFPVLFEDLVLRQSHLLDVTLCDYLPSDGVAHPFSKPRMPTITQPSVLPPAHHLVYLPPDAPDSLTLPDGTDPNQSPGKPFTRRMWAGGEISFDNSKQRRLILDGRRVACVEKIADLLIKGHEGSEKLFVRMERLIGSCDASEKDDAIRERFERGEGVSVKEVRNIFFSRPLPSDAKSKGPTPIKPHHEAEFSHTFKPNAKLLFRYSALTFDTHAIHRDIKFCHEVEHYPELIFPTFLRHQLARKHPEKNFAIREVKYRNTHPLYNEQPIKLSGCMVSPNHYELWEETPEGNVAVQYSATTEEITDGESHASLFADAQEYGLK